MLLSICYDDVPMWLQDGGFYKNLNPDDPKCQIEIPSECFRLTDDNVDTVQDLCDCLKVIHFWGLPKIPHNVLSFCYFNNLSEWEDALMETFGDEMPELTLLKSVFERQQLFSLENVLTISRAEFLTFWFSQTDPNSEHGKKAIAQACRFGRLDLVQTLHEKGFPWDSYAYCAAAQYGHLNVLQYLHEHGCLFDNKALVHAARGGQLVCLQYLHSLGCPWSADVTLEFAVPAHYAYLSQIELTDSIWTDEWSILPPVHGYLDCLRYALESNCKIHFDTSERACIYGLVDCLRLLVKHEVVIDISAAAIAATYGHLDCLMFLCDIGVDCSEEVSSTAARHGHLYCLQYLHENDYPWNQSTVNEAAKHGHLNCLRYAMEQGCPVDPRTVLLLAATSENTDCLSYFIDVLAEGLFV